MLQLFIILHSLSYIFIYNVLKNKCTAQVHHCWVEHIHSFDCLYRLSLNEAFKEVSTRQLFGMLNNNHRMKKYAKRTHEMEETHRGEYM